MKKKRFSALLIRYTLLAFIVQLILLELVGFIYENPKDFVPNKDKFKVDNSIYWRDYRGHVGDGLYAINHERIMPMLIIQYPYRENNNYDIILEGMYEKSFENDILYFYSADGYAIVYPESNLCKVLITPPPYKLVEELLGGSRLKENGYRTNELSSESEPENKFIVYLDSFEEFTEYEQKMLNALVDKHWK